MLLDIGRYKSFLPNLKESRVTKKKGTSVYAVVETDLPWPVKDCWVYVKFVRTNKSNGVIELKWGMMNGTMKNFL